jgi:small subunit ribosomal protein S21
MTGSIYGHRWSVVCILTYHPERKEQVSLVKVQLRNGESQQQLLRRFKQRVSRSGVLSTIRKKRWFVSKNEQRRLERKKAIRRLRRRMQKKNSRRRR